MDTAGLLGRGAQALRWLTNAVEVERSEEQQARVDAETARMELFCISACPYCIRVSRCVRRLALIVPRRDTGSDADAKRELTRGGGSAQVPCLKITAEDGSVQWMYESGDIIAFLRRRYRADAGLMRG